MPDKQERTFKGIWIPAQIWLSKDLTVMAKVLLAEIDSLDNKDGCFASNEYFAEFFGVSVRMIQKHLATLKARKLIYYASTDGRHRVLRVGGELKFTAEVKKSSRQTGTKVHPYNKVDRKVDNEEKSTAIADPKELTLYKLIEKVFTDKHPTHFNFKREGPHIKRFKEICERQNDPGVFAVRFMHVFYSMTKNGHDWATKGEPFMPSVMMSGRIYPRVEEEYLRKTTDDGTMAKIAKELFG